MTDKPLASQVKAGSLSSYANQFGRSLIRYRVVLFLIFVALVYGTVAFKIFTASELQPEDQHIETQVSNLTPQINESVAQKLKNLEDNSVNVQTLFAEARKNPFNE